MSDSAFRSRGSSPLAADTSDLAQHYVPKASSLFGGNRLEGVDQERQAASSQIQRSLKAWRKSKEDNAATNYVPQSSGGKPLPTDVRKKMEPRLGADLSSVRMHEGGEAAQNANKLGARAFTVGSDVTFGAGEFNPGTKEGDKLIAHELTHVVQGQKSGIQRAAEEGGDEKGGAEVSDPAEPAEQEADAKGDEVAGDIHDKQDGGDKDEKKKGGDKDDKEKSGLDAANEDDEKKKKGGDEAGAEGAEAAGGDVKEEAPPAAAKLFRKIYLGGRQAKPKPKKPLPAVDPEVRKEMEAIKQAVTADASKVKTLWSAVAAGMATVLGLAAKGAATGLGAGPVGSAVGGAAGAVVGASISIFKFGHEKHKLMEEKAELLDKIDQLVHQPEVIHEIWDYCTAIGPDLKVIEEKADAALEELSNKKKKLALKDKKERDKKAGPKSGPSGAEKAGHVGHKVHEVVEGVEAGAETGAAGAEAGAHAAHAGAHAAHAVGEGVLKVCEAAAPVLETIGHAAQIAGPAVGAFVTACDFKTYKEDMKKFQDLKAQIDAGGGAGGKST